MRTGIIARKVGMTRLYLADGTHVPVTVLRINNCQVLENKTQEKNGYTSITLGSEEAKAKNISKPQKEYFSKIKVAPKIKLKEFRVSDSNLIEKGKEIGANHFIVGQYIDATGTTIGKGFAGAMKRHNFGGLRASHGVSISHRSHGSTGNSQDPGRVFKGKKMAGHMGSRQRTIQNLQVVAADSDRGVIFIKGGVPGSKGSWLTLKDAVKKAVPNNAPFPAGFLGEEENSVKDIESTQESGQENNITTKQETLKEENQNTLQEAKNDSSKEVEQESAENTKKESLSKEGEKSESSNQDKDKIVDQDASKEEEK